MGYSTTKPLLHLCLYDFFVNFISMVTAICLCTSYYLLHGCTTYRESCHEFLLFIVCYAIFAILVELNSQYWINIYLFGLVSTCIEENIFVPSCSISHLFISIIKFFCCFLLLGKLFT